MENIFQDFKEWFELLNKHKVKYLIVGGYAVAFHGAPRFTGDIDVFIHSEKKNVKLLLSALEDFGFGNCGLTAEAFLKPLQIVELGVPPVRIDIVTSIQGVDFEEAWEGRDQGDYGKVRVFFISKDHLIRNKKSAGRKKDLADLESLGVEE